MAANELQVGGARHDAVPGPGWKRMHIAFAELVRKGPFEEEIEILPSPHHGDHVKDLCRLRPSGHTGVATPAARPTSCRTPLIQMSLSMFVPSRRTHRSRKSAY